MKRIRLSLLLPLAAFGSVLAAPLVAPQPEARRLEVLFFGAPTANHPGHDPITRYRVLKRHLGAEGIDLTYREDPATVLRPETLEKFDALLMYGNWEQHGPMPAEQLTALTEYVEAGGAFLPIHSASACYGGSPEFVSLVGGRFAHHGGGVFQATNVRPDHPILQGYGGFEAWDETYVHDRHGDDRVILERREDEPWTWVRRQGEGRVFYTAAGHDHQVWDLPAFHQLIRQAIVWSVGPEKRALLERLELPELEQEAVELPGYLERQMITRAQKPLPPEESIKLAQVPQGFELSLFASEPDIVNPIFVNWDHRGRAYVIQTTDYPNNLHEGNLGNDKIILCEDTDGDGSADRFTTFADQLSIPTSLVFANGGVVCTNGSEMLFLKDTDGDDRADVREVLFSGFNMGDTHAGVSNLRYGHDGWIYATIGYSGFRGTVGGERHQFGQAVFRFRPDGSKLEVIQGTTNNTWGLGTTSDFDIMGSTANSNPSFYLTHPQADYAAAGMQAPRTPRADDNPPFHPSSADIRQVDMFGHYTAAAGHAFYTSERFPEPWRERVAFVTEATGKLVGTFDITREGAGFRADQRPNNLYNSADAWSGPVCAEVGPDGALWICDWYNLIIQHNPTPNRQSAGMNARNGRGNAYETPVRDKRHGRIYRVYPGGSPDDPNPGLDPADPATLRAALDHPNLLWRLHAQRLLVERGGKDGTAELTQIAANGGRAGAHALYALAGLGALEGEVLESAMKSVDRPLRRAAILSATPEQVRQFLVSDGNIDVADPRDLADALVALSRLPQADPSVGQALFHLITTREETVVSDVTLKDAWQIAASKHAPAVVAAAKAAGFGDGASSEPKEMPNLLPNPGFSETVDGRPADWTDLRMHGGPADAVKLAASSEGHEDSGSLEMASDRPVDCGPAVTVPVRKHTRYTLSAWIKTDDVRPLHNGPGALLNIHGGERTPGVHGTRDWTRVSIEIDTGDRSEVLIHCLFGGYGGATGTAWFDDVAFREVPGGSGAAGMLAALERRGEHEGSAPPLERKHQPDPAVHERGAAVYNLTCVACHGPDGAGVEGAFPPLDESEWVTQDPSVPIRVLLNGLSGPVTVAGQEFNSVMPPHVDLDDRQIADVLTYVRQSWRNDAPAVKPDEVKATRAKFSGRSQPWTAAELGH